MGKQETVVCCTFINAELCALCEAGKELVWVMNLLRNDFDIQCDKPILYEDNQSCIKLTENLVFHDRSNILT